MGLDMSLSKRTYVKNWSYDKPEERYEITVTRGGKPIPKAEIDPEKIAYIIEDAGEWRKANAIHRWFVDNVQEGEDDCGEYYVNEEKMEQLRNTCQRILDNSKLVPGKVYAGTKYEKNANGETVKTDMYEDGSVIEDPALAQELLPAQEGFFFGSTQYDEYYFQQLEYTKNILEDALASGNGSYYYSSSW